MIEFTSIGFVLLILGLLIFFIIASYSCLSSFGDSLYYEIKDHKDDTIYIGKEVDWNNGAFSFETKDGVEHVLIGERKITLKECEEEVK